MYVRMFNVCNWIYLCIQNIISCHVPVVPVSVHSLLCQKTVTQQKWVGVLVRHAIHAPTECYSYNNMCLWFYSDIPHNCNVIMCTCLVATLMVYVHCLCTKPLVRSQLMYAMIQKVTNYLWMTSLLRSAPLVGTTVHFLVRTYILLIIRSRLISLMGTTVAVLQSECLYSLL